MQAINADGGAVVVLSQDELNVVRAALRSWGGMYSGPHYPPASELCDSDAERHQRSLEIAGRVASGIEAELWRLHEQEQGRVAEGIQ